MFQLDMYNMYLVFRFLASQNTYLPLSYRTPDNEVIGVNYLHCINHCVYRQDHVIVHTALRVDTLPITCT